MNKEICLFESVFLISMMFFVLLITSIMFLFGLKISYWIFLLAILCSFGAIYCFIKSIKQATIITITGLFVIFACVALSGHFYDWTWDGNTYHKGMVAMLKDGWNPLTETFYTYSQNNFPFMSKATYTWYDAYPKGCEIWGGVLYNLTNNIENGKSFNVMMLFALFWICYVFLDETKLLHRWQSVCCSIFLVINPSVLAQLFTYYTDGILYQMLLLCFVSLLYLTFYNRGKYVNLCWFLVFVSINIGFNIKFSAIIFFAILCLSFAGYWLVLKIKNDGFNKKTFLYFKNAFLIMTGSVLLGTLITGSTSYVINTIRYANPLYTMIGADSTEMITSQLPIVFSDMSNIERFVASLFSFTSNSKKLEALQWKMPLFFSNGEFGPAQGNDTRTAGWGMFFSGILLISLVVLAIYLLKKENKFIKAKPITVILFVIYALAICSVPGLSWARYNLVLFWIVIAALIYIFINYNQQKNENSVMLFCSGILVALLFINMVPCFSLNYYRFKEYDNIQAQLARFKIITEYNDVTVSVGNYDMYGRIFNLYDNGINTFLVDDIDITNCNGQLFNAQPVYYDINNGIMSTDDLTDFLSYYDENKILLIAVKDEASEALTSDIVQKMQSLGLKFELPNHYRWSYLAVLDGNKVIYENLADEQMSYNDKIGNITVSMLSAGYETGNAASIIIDDEEFAFNERGLNIVMYDKVNDNVIDSICADTYADNKLTRMLP